MKTIAFMISATLLLAAATSAQSRASDMAIAATAPKIFTTEHVLTANGRKLPYSATLEEFVTSDKTGQPAVRLFTTSYLATHVKNPDERPVVFMFNGGPTAAAIGVHLQFGPLRYVQDSSNPSRFEDNPHTLLDAADLVMFDPGETGFSRLLNEADRGYLFSTEGDCDSFVQLVIAWRERHHRTRSPLYLLGESYGSIRQVVSGAMLAKRGVLIDGQIILGDSLFLQETSRRTHNIISTATSLPLLAMTAAFHHRADKQGKSDADFLDEVYAYAMNEYLVALAKGYTLSEDERRAVAQRLSAYTGIAAEYFLSHGLTIAKQEFNRQLLPGKLLNANDTRIATPLPAPPKNQEEAEKQQSGDLLDPLQRIYTDYMDQQLKVTLPGADYRITAEGAFAVWDWGPGCNDYLMSAGLCNRTTPHPTIFMDYDWPETLKGEFSDGKFRAMIIAGYYDGLSSIGTHRYLAAQLGFPRDRFSIHEYAAGHMTAADPIAQPLIARDIHEFLKNGR
jgi:carboxypeptidase C (cathepsin A)